MLNALKTEMDKTRTENGAATNVSSGSACLDLFFRIGAMRNENAPEIIRCFLRAYAEDRDAAMKILFYARDIRGGLGERRVFREILTWLADNSPASVKKNIPLIAEYGRYDDLLPLIYTKCKDEAVAYIGDQLNDDMKNLASGGAVSLLAKWLPSVNASSDVTVGYAKALCRSLGLREPEYRRILSSLRERIKIVENDLRRKDYSFDYAKLPSMALLKYRKAFERNDKERYTGFLDDVCEGKTDMNTSVLMPYDIVAPVVKCVSGWHRCNGELTDTERKSLDISWNALEDHTSDENAIAVIDGSGSMYGYGTPIPASVAMSLGIYFAERNSGAFKNHFITFSENPRLVEIKGSDIAEKVAYCSSFNEIANTNVERVFSLILDTAVKHGIPQSDMPKRLYIISDMEFDCCADDADATVFHNAQKRFAENGYSLPDVVFWNVQSRNSNVPVTVNDSGVILVSGCTPRIFKMVASGGCEPYNYMMNVIGSERYEKVAA